MRGFFLLICSALFAGAPAFAAEQVPLEFWFFRPYVSIPNITESSTPSLGGGGDVRFVVENAKQEQLVENIRWEDDRLKIGSLSLVLSGSKAYLQSNIAGIRSTLGLGDNVSITVRSRNEIEFVFPPEIFLTPEVAGNRVSFKMADESFRAAIDKQVDEIFSVEHFDRYFEITETFHKALKPNVRKKIEELKQKALGDARAAIKKALTADALSQVLVVGSQALPPGFPLEVISGQWALRRLESGKNILWRLAPADSNQSAYTTPFVPNDTKNVMTVVLSHKLIRMLFENGMNQASSEADRAAGAMPLDKVASVALAGALGIESGGEPLSIVSTGPAGPRVAVWTMGGQRHFLDVLLTLRSSDQKEHPVGAVLEFEPGGIPQIVNLVSLNKPEASATKNADSWTIIQETLTAALLGMGNKQLDKNTGKWIISNDQLAPLAIRSLGKMGERSPGIPDHQFSHALAVDFAVKP